MELVDECSMKNRRWIALCVWTLIAVVSIPYMLTFEISNFISESSWSRSFHSVFGWQHTVDNLSHNFSNNESEELQRLLKATSLRDNTVIITTLNAAWSAEESMIDLFLESFKVGNNTKHLLENMLIVALDRTALDRCRRIHPFCFMLETDGVDFTREKFFMSSDYLKMMWRRIDFLRTVLELGYNFVFSDADIMWFRDPFVHFSRDADFEIACDHYNGRPMDLTNKPNGGFVHATSNVRTISFYKLWYESRLSYLGMHDQDVLDRIKLTPEFKNIKLRTRFLNTEVFSNFCEFNKSSPRTVYTIHANCCKGLSKKIKDLRILINDWNNVSEEWSVLTCPKRRPAI